MRLPWRRGYIESAAWVADDTLLAIGWFLAPAETVRAWVEYAGQRRSLEIRAFGVSRSDLPDRPHPVGKVIVIRFPAIETSGVLAGNLVIDGSSGRFVTSSRALSRVLGDVGTFVRARLGWLDASARDNCMAFLVDALDQASATSVQLARSLRDIRNALRGPTRDTLAGHGSGVHLDRVFRIDDRSFYLRGWAEHNGGDPARVSVMSPEGRRVELLKTAFRHPWTDVDGQLGRGRGFVAHVSLDGPSLAQTGWTAEHVGEDGTRDEVDGPRVVSDRSEVLRAILEDLRFDDQLKPTLVRDHAFPALRRLQELHEQSSKVEEVIAFGTIAERPDVSIVVPLFRRFDLIEHQLAHFVDDPEIGRVELLYVLDSPELAQMVKETASDLHTLYRMPFRLVLLRSHVGFGLANNAGVSMARGRILLLLNSDVFPVAPGWLGRLLRFYDSTPRIGALGPKLLFADDTLQHAGLYFNRPTGSAVWTNKHYYKGFHRRLPAANVMRRVPAVTGACLMIARDLYVDQGGLRACYVDGDYEDSDLCLRLSTAGYENWYLPEVELYHLENQSYEWEEARVRSAYYNAWLHDQMWRNTIEEVMRQYGA